MNIRFTYRLWLGIAISAAVIGIALVYGLLIAPGLPTEAQKEDAAAMTIIRRRCQSCHSAQPTDDLFVAAPVGVMFDTQEQVIARLDRIIERAVVAKTMPYGNKTDMTDTERELIGVWAARHLRNP